MTMQMIKEPTKAQWQKDIDRNRSKLNEYLALLETETNQQSIDKLNKMISYRQYKIKFIEDIIKNIHA